MKFKYMTIVASLAVSIFLGACAGVLTSNLANEEPEHHHSAFRVNNETLEEEMWFVDVIARGTVETIHSPIIEQSDIPTKRDNSVFVTTSIFIVKELLYGNTSTTERIEVHVLGREAAFREGDELILLLREAEEGIYYPYTKKNGVWKIEDGKVVSETTAPILQDLIGKDAEAFEKRIVKAAKNKKWNDFFIYPDK